jgi:hypothetical protein
VINPLAIGVTIGGLLLDIVVPRPKPRVGTASSYLPPVRRRPEDTFAHAHVEYERRPVASGAPFQEPAGSA